MHRSGDTTGLFSEGCSEVKKGLLKKDTEVAGTSLAPKVFNKLDHSGQRVLSHGLRCPWRVRGGEISTREGCKEDDPTNKNMTK
jgi:hypothetical protein